MQKNPGTKAVRKNITIPAWLDTFAQKNGLSLSKIVQDSLLDLAKETINAADCAQRLKSLKN